jgi:fructooligosaccharide transport system permease protein
LNRSLRLRRNLESFAVVMAFLGPALVGLVLFQYWPFITALRNSFSNLNLLIPDQAAFVGMANYAHMLRDERFYLSLYNTFFYTTAKVIIQLPIALALAMLVQREIRGIAVVRSAIFAPTVTAVSIVAVIWNLMYDPQHGFFNTILQAVGIGPQPFLTSGGQAMPAIIVMSIWQDAGFTMLIFLSGLQGIPEEIYETARMDGASRFALIRYITLPLLQRTTLFAVVTTTIFAFRVFTPIYIMTQGGPFDKTLVGVYYIYQQGFTYLDMGYASALAVVMIVLLLIISAFQGFLFRTQFQY